MKFLFQKGLSSDSKTIRHMVRGEIEILLIPNYEQTKYILIDPPIAFGYYVSL